MPAGMKPGMHTESVTSQRSAFGCSYIFVRKFHTTLIDRKLRDTMCRGRCSSSPFYMRVWTGVLQPQRTVLIKRTLLWGGILFQGCENISNLYFPNHIPHLCASLLHIFCMPPCQVHIYIYPYDILIAEAYSKWLVRLQVWYPQFWLVSSSQLIVLLKSPSEGVTGIELP